MLKRSAESSRLRQKERSKGFTKNCAEDKASKEQSEETCIDPSGARAAMKGAKMGSE